VLEDTVFWGWLALLAFGVLTFGAVEPWSLAMFQIGACVVFLWWVVVGMRSGKLRVAFPGIFVPGLAFFGLIAFQIFANVTAYRFASESTLSVYFTYGIGIFLGAQLLNSERRFQSFAIAASGFGFVIACLAILQAVTSPGEIYWTVVPTFGDGVFGPYVNHSHYAGLMELLIPFPFVLGQSRNLPQGFRHIAFIAGTVMLGSVFMSGSRGGIVAVVVELCLMYVFIFRRSEERNGHRAFRWMNLWAALGALALVILLGGQEMFMRISTLKDPYGQTVGATRIAIAKDCLVMFGRHPLFGWGAGTFQDTYPAFRSFSTNLVVNAAHNDYLQLLVEFGLAGFAICVLFLACAYHRLPKLLANWKDSWPHAASLAAALGAAGILVHSLADFNLQVPGNAAIFYVMCMVSSLSPPEPDVVLAHDRL
jgi:O-antigen ligase